MTFCKDTGLAIEVFMACVGSGMVGEEDDYNTAMKLPDIKVQVEDNDEQIDES